jgi:hypothetical protein
MESFATSSTTIFFPFGLGTIVDDATTLGLT